jgi:hypothetical protein
MDEETKKKGMLSNRREWELLPIVVHGNGTQVRQPDQFKATVY